MKLSKESRKLAKQMYQASFTDGRLDNGKIQSLAASVIENKPRHFVEVLKSYHRLIRLETERHHAHIESAAPLDNATVAQITNDLKTRFGSDLTITFSVNPEFIGGLRIKIGSDVWDNSVKSRLQRLQDQLTQA
ncbi:MAG: ATP synthase F1 subunit delta [Chthoniobacteraceae bacterium]